MNDNEYVTVVVTKNMIAMMKALPDDGAFKHALEMMVIQSLHQLVDLQKLDDTQDLQLRMEVVNHFASAAASEPMKKLTDIFPPDQFTITHRNDQSILIECVQASDEVKK